MTQETKHTQTSIWAFFLNVNQFCLVRSKSKQARKLRIFGIQSGSSLHEGGTGGGVGDK